MNKKIVIIGAGVAGINAATKLVDNGYPGELITIIDKGKDPYNRKHEEVMEGMLGAGGWSDGKLTYHTSIGGVLSKYTGEDKAYNLMDQVIENFKRFHPNPSVIMKSDPQEEPEFIKPYFGLRLFPVYHIGSDYLHEIGKKWYDYLLSKKINFLWETSVYNINLKKEWIIWKDLNPSKNIYSRGGKEKYDILIYGTGKSGMDFTQKLINEYKLSTEAKSVQIGVRYEAPMKYFQKLIDISYDFKLYQKPNDKVSLRSFCTNNEAAYVAVENTYGNVSYNGHALKDPQYKNNMTNFGILMEIKNIDNPFEWARKAVEIQQSEIIVGGKMKKVGMHYSPTKRSISSTSEGSVIEAYEFSDIDTYEEFKNNLSLSLGEHTNYIFNFIEDLNKVFNIDGDYSIYTPEVKYTSPEPLVDYNNLALIDYPNVYFVGDALSARGITVSGAQGIYVAEYLLKN